MNTGYSSRSAIRRVTSLVARLALPATIFVAAPAAAVDRDRQMDAYVANLRPQIAAAVGKDGKSLTPEERTLIEVHWRDARTAIRVREVAAELKDGASVSRSDAILARMDQKLLARLEELNANAPPPRASPSKHDGPPAPVPNSDKPSGGGGKWDDTYRDLNPSPYNDGLLCPGVGPNKGNYVVAGGRLKFDVVFVDRDDPNQPLHGKRVMHIDVPITEHGNKARVDATVPIAPFKWKENDAGSPERGQMKVAQTLHVTAHLEVQAPEGSDQAIMDSGRAMTTEVVLVKNFYGCGGSRVLADHGTKLLDRSKGHFCSISNAGCYNDDQCCSRQCNGATPGFAGRCS
jgi:hypothetical protein